MNSSIPGLSTAIRSYTSEKLKERSQGLEQIRDIFDSRDNVSRFQETASKEGGAGWVAFFQCLFQVVVMEKKAVLKKAASAQGTSLMCPRAEM
jgi:ataxia telangiectasia mutated family protein